MATAARKNNLGPPRFTRLLPDDDRYLLERAQKAGLPHAYFIRSWVEKALRLERRSKKRAA